MSDLKWQGFLQKARGRIKSAWGDLTDDDLDRAAGDRDQLVGVIKERTGEAEDTIRRRLQEFEADEDKQADR
ncbi:MAG TPA: CsbD family protein [Dehalococcoidia bacterium]|nr:CsbD family protein [Dehalococcoidia bacterium]